MRIPLVFVYNALVREYFFNYRNNKENRRAENDAAGLYSSDTAVYYICHNEAYLYGYFINCVALRIEKRLYAVILYYK